jgi:dihydroneopterin aldolase
MAPTDRIELRGLVVTGICGALPEERERAQPLEVDLDVIADLSKAGASDDLDDTLDYGAITTTVERVIVGGTPQLLEHLAQNLADAVLADPRASSVTVSVRKLRPPVPQALATSGVTITRGR